MPVPLMPGSEPVLSFEPEQAAPVVIPSMADSGCSCRSCQQEREQRQAAAQATRPVVPPTFMQTSSFYDGAVAGRISGWDMSQANIPRASSDRIRGRYDPSTTGGMFSGEIRWLAPSEGRLYDEQGRSASTVQQNQFGEWWTTDSGLRWEAT